MGASCSTSRSVSTSDGPKPASKETITVSNTPKNEQETRKSFAVETQKPNDDTKNASRTEPETTTASPSTSSQNEDTRPAAEIASAEPVLVAKSTTTGSNPQLVRGGLPPIDAARQPRALPPLGSQAPSHRPSAANAILLQQALNDQCKEEPMSDGMAEPTRTKNTKLTGNAIIDELFPQTLVTPKGESVDVSCLAGKVVGMYFGAHWCPPCRGFAPLLCKWFGNFKKNHAKKDEFELVFISSDKSEETFADYHHSMNFYAFPFNERESKSTVSARFGVRGIPALVFVDAKGDVISTNARRIITDDEKAVGFPWTPKPFVDILGDSFITNTGINLTRSSLVGKYIGLFFSAYWSMPAKTFTGQLVSVYNRLQASGKGFEIIFVSSDQEKSGFAEYFADMPWLAIAYEESQRRIELSAYFDVKGIPALLILDPQLNLVTIEGRNAVAADPQGHNYPWRPKALSPFDGKAMNVIDEFPFFLVITDGSDEEIQQAIAAVTPFAEAETAKPNPRLRFFYVEDPDEDILDLTSRAAQLSSKIKIVILDMLYSKKWSAPKQTLEPSNIASLVDGFLAGTLQPTQFIAHEMK